MVWLCGKIHVLEKVKKNKQFQIGIDKYHMKLESIGHVASISCSIWRYICSYLDFFNFFRYFISFST